MSLTNEQLLQYGAILLTALMTFLVKHYFPTLGNSILPSPTPVPVVPSVPATPVPTQTGHPVVDLLRLLLHNATAQTAPLLLSAIPAILNQANGVPSLPVILTPTPTK